MHTSCSIVVYQEPQLTPRWKRELNNQYMLEMSRRHVPLWSTRNLRWTRELHNQEQDGAALRNPDLIGKPASKTKYLPTFTFINIDLTNFLVAKG